MKCYSVRHTADSFFLYGNIPSSVHSPGSSTAHPAAGDEMCTLLWGTQIVGWGAQHLGSMEQSITKDICSVHACNHSTLEGAAGRWSLNEAQDTECVLCQPSCHKQASTK